MSHTEGVTKLMAHDQRREGERTAVQLLQEKNEWDNRKNCWIIANHRRYLLEQQNMAKKEY